MSPAQMRKEIAQYYGAASPFAKRLDKMSNDQVTAIYFRMKSKGALK
jgi:hypothetical protein